MWSKFDVEVPHTELPKTCEESTHGMVKGSSSEVTRQEVVGRENSTGNLCKHIEDVSLKEISLAFPTKDLSNVVIHHGDLSLIIVNFRIPNFIYMCTDAYPCG